MKITFIANACQIIEHNGFKILCDPWIEGSAFDGAWIHEEPLKTAPQDLADYDVLYISHIHDDHLHPPTLKYFDKSKPVICLKGNMVKKKMEALGFTNIREALDDSIYEDTPFKITILSPFQKNPFHSESSEIGNLVDSALYVEADGIKLLSTNDNLPDIESAKQLKYKYGPFDLVQLNYNAAGPYPANCDNLTYWKKKVESDRFIRKSLDYLKSLYETGFAKKIMPFAGSYKLIDEKKNDYLGTCKADYAKAYLELENIPCITLKEGEVYDFNPPDIYQLLTKARDHLWKHQERLNCFEDYNIFINWDDGAGYYFPFNQNSNSETSGNSKSIEFMMSESYLRKILNRETNWNNGEIGCHISFGRYPNVYRPDIHMMMAFFHC